MPPAAMSYPIRLTVCFKSLEFVSGIRLFSSQDFQIMSGVTMCFRFQIVEFGVCVRNQAILQSRFASAHPLRCSWPELKPPVVSYVGLFSHRLTALPEPELMYGRAQATGSGSVNRILHVTLVALIGHFGSPAPPAMPILGIAGGAGDPKCPITALQHRVLSVQSRAPEGKITTIEAYETNTSRGLLCDCV